ncbi:MAG TPA: GNAT family N-acetyltransferase [Methanocorpusculum sp.]|nr:GNAT family N-acetyltransferase [Methanocorpusculum sp.]
MTTEQNSSGADSFQILPLAECPERRDAAMEIFYYSFPENEQTEISKLPDLLPPEVQFEEWALVYESRTVGYMIALFTDDIAYFLHLAVAEECRGKGFGSRAIEFFNRKFASHLIFFAVETPSEDAENQWQRLARIRLYERYGYRLAGIDILDDGTPFSVMCRSTASEEDIRKIRAFMEAMGKMTGEDVTIL